jgi:hypothetical protein
MLEYVEPINNKATTIMMIVTSVDVVAKFPQGIRVVLIVSQKGSLRGIHMKNKEIILFEFHQSFYSF